MSPFARIFSFHSPFSSCTHNHRTEWRTENFIFFRDFGSASTHRETYQITLLLILFACCRYKEHAVRLFVFAYTIDAALHSMPSNQIESLLLIESPASFLNYIFLVLYISLPLTISLFQFCVQFILRRLEMNAIGYRFNTQHNRSSHSIESKSGAAKSDATIIRKLFMQCN